MGVLSMLKCCRRWDLCTSPLLQRLVLCLGALEVFVSLSSFFLSKNFLFDEGPGHLHTLDTVIIEATDKDVDDHVLQSG